MRWSSTQLDARVDQMVERCRAEGMNLTPQRVVIYRALLEAEHHPSPEQLFDTVKASLPRVSLATIYKTLDTLVSLGLATEVAATGDTKRYDGNMDRHHHLVCTSCGKVEDFDGDALADVPVPKSVNGFQPQYLSIHIHGRCRACESSQPAAKKEKRSWPKN